MSAGTLPSWYHESKPTVEGCGLGLGDLPASFCASRASASSVRVHVRCGEGAQENMCMRFAGLDDVMKNVGELSHDTPMPYYPQVCDQTT